ncbi:hypothetical protein GCM10010411_76770 [Actinomadura fulvescens]|uniref:Uncharacterized protein n=1 Tax=Actinomadura fulvescens TaxID=46160 RepID=A0ABN3QJY3_9ACTN
MGDHRHVVEELKHNPPRLIISHGMGVDTGAMTHRLLEEPDLIGIPPSQWLVVTAMTGHEIQRTGELMQEFALPMFQQHGVRYAQISRACQDGGYAVLSPTLHPTEMVMTGPWTLGHELTAVGTVPQVTGAKTCSYRSKRQPIEWFLDDVLGAAPYVHLMGYSVEEGKRIAEDRLHTKGGRRTPRHPLAEWTWDRAEAAGYIHHTLGVEWIRSACGFCCYANIGRGINELIHRWTIDPHAAAEALIYEQRALGINANAALFANRTAHDIAREHRLDAARELAEHHLAKARWALYEVRRLYWATGPTTPGGPAGKGPVWRAISKLASGTRDAMHQALTLTADASDARMEIDKHGFPRAWTLPKGDTYPTCESMLAISLDDISDKARDTFEERWFEHTDLAPLRPRQRQLELFPAA